MWVRTLGSKDPLEEGMASLSCLKNSTGRGTWWATVHGVAKSQTRLKWFSTRSNFTVFSHLCIILRVQIVWWKTGHELSCIGKKYTLATQCEELTHCRSPDAGKNWAQEEKGMAKDEMAGWHHQLNGHESKQTLGDSEGQRGLLCCSPWGRKESDTV